MEEIEFRFEYAFDLFKRCQVVRWMIYKALELREEVETSYKLELCTVLMDMDEIVCKGYEISQ